MSLSNLNWRKFIFTTLLLLLILTITTAVSLAQSAAGIPQAGAAGSSITICLGNNINQPDTVQFSGDLGSFTLSGPNDCRTTPGLSPGIYTINENLPAGYFGWVVNCLETAGSGLSQWQTTPLSAVIDLAADSEVECPFYSLENPDEPNDSREQATPTNYGGIVSAAIGPHPDVGPDGDKDFYKFQGYAGDTIFVDADVYPFYLSPNPVWLTLRDEGGALLAQKTNTNSPFLWLEQQLPETGSYSLEIWVDCLDDSHRCNGDYAWYMGLIDPYEPNDSPATAAVIKFGDVLRAYIDNYDGDPIVPTDYDYYRFTASAGDEIVIDVSRFNDVQILSCELLDAGQSLLAYDSGSGCNFEQTLSNGGDFYINVYHDKSLVLSSLASSYWYGPWNGPYAINLMYQNKPPLAKPESYKVFSAETLTIKAPGVLGNDSDPDGDTLTAVLTADVQHGSLNLAGDGSFTYEPDPGFVGQDTFQYHAFDGRDPSEPVTVTITIDPQTLYLPVVLAD